MPRVIRRIAVSRIAGRPPVASPPLAPFARSMSEPANSPHDDVVQAPEDAAPQHGPDTAHQVPPGVDAPHPGRSSESSPPHRWAVGLATYPDIS
jgi:hypothetical protein